MRLRGMVLPTCRMSSVPPSSGPHHRAASASAGQSGSERKRRVQRVGHDHRARFVYQPMGQQRVTRRTAAAHHPRRRAQAGQQAAAHRPSHGRARCGARQHAGEGIHVVARHDRAPGGQRARQVRVAVIDDVEQIEAVDLAAQPPRVVPVAVDHPVGGVQQRALSEPGHAREPPHHRRTETERVDGAVGLRFERTDQHVRHQVHAGPAAPPANPRRWPRAGAITRAPHRPAWRGAPPPPRPARRAARRTRRRASSGAARTPGPAPRRRAPAPDRRPP